ncbi:poly-gamma-glutamate hydrolase family protein [Burkholderia cepacia]|uniref:poly-gamma-glutamate hydrolase family protein n=1 Tax=Burkholderia cepacia TaxID=292 RepID=UPI00075DD21B|nr:poly-gamma-glutamate hydrolase family protein [Burkholderia cepacia]
MSVTAQGFKNFKDLAAARIEGTDYRIHVQRTPGSSVAVIAPHGGRIEPHTSAIAREVAGTDFNLYLFEGIRQQGNYAALHLTSHRFDEPRCLALLSYCDYVVAIHGCRGATQKVLLGGLDQRLKDAAAQAIADRGIEVVRDGHPFPATEPSNICNRGRQAIGLQVEISSALRGSGARHELCAAIRVMLLRVQA